MDDYGKIDAAQSDEEKDQMQCEILSRCHKGIQHDFEIFRELIAESASRVGYEVIQSKVEVGKLDVFRFHCVLSFLVTRG